MHRGRTAVTIGDVDPRGRCRLDAIMRHLQDIARSDWIEAGLDGTSGWVMRRILAEVAQWPQLDEPLELATWCSGYGGRWAERRTRVTGAAGARVDSVALWVQVDLDTGRPARITDEFLAVYGEAAQGRKVSARTQLATTPATDANSVAWPIRLSDLDIVGRVNNAAQYAALEEALDLSGSDVSALRVEVEFGASLERDGGAVLAWSSSGPEVEAWLVGNGGGDAATVARIRPL